MKSPARLLCIPFCIIAVACGCAKVAPATIDDGLLNADTKTIVEVCEQKCADAAVIWMGDLATTIEMDTSIFKIKDTTYKAISQSLFKTQPESKYKRLAERMWNINDVEKVFHDAYDKEASKELIDYIQNNGRFVLYKEIDGFLCVNMDVGMTSMPHGVVHLDTLKEIDRTSNKIVISVDYEVSVDTIEKDRQLTIVREDGQWKYTKNSLYRKDGKYYV